MVALNEVRRMHILDGGGWSTGTVSRGGWCNVWQVSGTGTRYAGRGMM